MRTIKFRVWDIKEQKMFFSHIHRCFYLDIFAGNMLFGDPNNFIIQQFTGLKDQNGKEIYEGDILYRPAVRIKYICEYDVDECAYILTYDNGDDYIYLTDFKEIGVIGNIYENKELLNENNKI